MTMNEMMVLKTTIRIRMKLDRDNITAKLDYELVYF